MTEGSIVVIMLKFISILLLCSLANGNLLNVYKGKFKGARVSYGEKLMRNKARLNCAFNACDVKPEYNRLMMAMAMLETTTLDSNLRDRSKDTTKDGSKNVSLFNLNVDMIRYLGYKQSPETLNTNIRDTVCLLVKSFKVLGVERSLAFVRGGRTGFNDGVSYGVKKYKEVISAIIQEIQRDPKLMYDDRRVQIFLEPV